MMRKTKGTVNKVSRSYLDKANKFVSEGAEKVSTTLERLNDSHICLGITGLSQSGKSTFVTSLIDQLNRKAGQGTRCFEGFESRLS